MYNIELCWFSVVMNHSRPLKLIILAEAPLSDQKYFYNKQGSFLDSLRLFYSQKRANLALKNKSLPAIMIEERILLMDIFAFPIPSDLYKKDKNNSLFSEVYFCEKINLLKKHGLLNEDTKFVFRYKLLIKKDLHKSKCLNGLNIIHGKNNFPISLNKSEKPQVLNPEIESLLNN